jgi:hypothetical protein
MLATAAFADAKAKEDRRQEWDRVIAEAKSGIPMNDSACMEGSPSQPLSDSLRQILSSNGKLQSQNSVSKTPCGGNGWTVPPRTQATSLESKLWILDSQLKDVSISSKSVAKQEVVSFDEDWVEERSDAELPPREPTKEVHLRKMEEMVVKLVDQLLLQTGIFSAENSLLLGPNDIREPMKEMGQRIETLRSSFTRVPAYCWDDVESVEEQRSALHHSLTTLCHQTTASKPSIDLMLAKICYNLLISTAPPSIVTYNTLLREFNRLRQPHLSQIVVDSYFQESRFKVNKVTCRLILDHYRIKQDPKGFDNIVKKMGGHSKSMRIRRRHTDDLWIPGIKDWALKSKVILREAHLYHKMPRGAAIFDSLIHGSLEMNGIRSAVRYVRAAFREGFEVTSETLCSVINRCVQNFDHLAGISLLRAILWWTAWNDFPPMFSSKTVRAVMYKLLNLCGIDSSLGSQQTLRLNLPGELLERMLRHMRIESVADSVEHFAELISSLEKMFCAPENQPSTVVPWNESFMSDYDRTREAIELLRRAKGWDMIRNRRMRQRAAEGRWMRLRAFEYRLGGSAQRINAGQSELLRIAFAGLSPERKKHYLDSIRLLEKSGRVVKVPERLELVRGLERVQSQVRQKKIERPLDTVQDGSSEERLVAKETVAIKPSRLLLPAFAIAKSQPQVAAV